MDSATASLRSAPAAAYPLRPAPAEIRRKRRGRRPHQHASAAAARVPPHLLLSELLLLLMVMLLLLRPWRQAEAACCAAGGGVVMRQRGRLWRVERQPDALGLAARRRRARSLRCLRRCLHRESRR